MKYALLFLVLLLVACDPLANWNNCPWEPNKEFVRIVAFTDMDTIISSEKFTIVSDSGTENVRYETDYKDLGSKPIALSVTLNGDSLNYSLEIENQSNIFVVVDSVYRSCDSSYFLSKKGYGHYRVDSKQLYSCVFYYEQMCY